MDTFVPQGENPDWSDQPPQQTQPGWRPTWRPKKQRKNRASAAAPQGYPAQYPQPVQQYAAPQQYQKPPPLPPPQPPQYVPPTQTAAQAYPYQAQRLPQTYLTTEPDDGYQYEPLAVPEAPENLGRPDPLQQQYPYPEVGIIDRAADNARVRPNRDYLNNWRQYAVIHAAPNIVEISREQASVPLKSVDFLKVTRDRAARGEDIGRMRVDTYRARLRNNQI